MPGLRLTGARSAGSSALDVYDEGVLVRTTQSALNFVGAGVAATADPADPSRTIITIAGGGGGVPPTRTLTAGAGLTGGGDLSADRTFDVGAGTGITVAVDSMAVDQTFSPTWTGAHTWSVPLLGPAGTALLPSYSFSGDPDTGMFNVGANFLGFSIGGVFTMSISVAAGIFSILPFVAPLGTAALPSYTFGGDVDTGMFESAANTIGWATGGVSRLSLSTASLTSTLVVLGPAGAVGAPTYSFSGDPDTGILSGGVNTLNITTGGANRCIISAASCNLSGSTQVFAAVGAVGTPGYAFNTDTNTGMFGPAADTLGLVTGGVTKLSLGVSAHTLSQTVAVAGSPVMWTANAAAHTTLAAGVEASDVFWNLTRTVQFATGALATQRAYRVGQPTYGFVAASTITTAATFAILGAPVAGTNATITTALALWVQAGRAQFDGTLFANDGINFANDITPAALVAASTNNDYNPAGLTTAAVVRQDTGAAAVVTGMVPPAPTDGRLILLLNISTANTFTLNNEDAGSAAANRFTLPGGVARTVGPGSSVWLYYDSTSTRWRLAAFSS